MPHLDDLVVAHQLAGPLDQPDADQQQREAQRRAQGDVGGAQPEDRLHGLAVATAVDLEGEVGDDEQHGADRREPEQPRDLTLGALLGLRVDVGRPPHVLGQARVGDRLVGDELAAVPVVGVAVSGQLGKVAVVVGHAAASSFFLVERAVWAAIQVAKPTRAPIPTIQAIRPSATGPVAAEAEAAVLGLLTQRVEVGDDVALLLRREVAVGEGVHLAGAGQHRLVDVLGLGVAQVGGVAAVRHRTALAGEVVAGGAVGQEDLATAGDRLLALLLRQAGQAVVGRVGDRGAGPEARDVRRQGRDLLVVVGHRLGGVLGARLGRRHPAGADLEVDRGGTDTHQGRAELVAVQGGDALAVLAVAERAADEEQLAALVRQLLVALGRVGRRRRRERGVEGPGQHQAQHQQQQPGDRAAAVAGKATGGAVQEAHGGPHGRVYLMR